jgi:hypothetical protein
MIFTEKLHFSIAVTYVPEDILRTDWKIQRRSDSAVDASSERT